MLVTNRPLTFTEPEGRSVVIPAGAECVVFNRQMDTDPDAEQLIADARHRNAVAGQSIWLVMLILGRARLLKRSEVCVDTAAVAPVEKPKRQAALF